REWDEELLRIFAVPRSVLPEVRSSSEIFGETNLFSDPIRIAGIAGDQQAALFGQACRQSGMAKNTYGTGCFLLLNTGAKPAASANRLLTTIAWQFGAHLEYALEGSVFVAGAGAQWLRDRLRLIKSGGGTAALAAGVSGS